MAGHNHWWRTKSRERAELPAAEMDTLSFYCWNRSRRKLNWKWRCPTYTRCLFPLTLYLQNKKSRCHVSQLPQARNLGQKYSKLVKGSINAIDCAFTDLGKAQKMCRSEQQLRTLPLLTRGVTMCHHFPVLPTLVCSLKQASLSPQTTFTILADKSPVNTLNETGRDGSKIASNPLLTVLQQQQRGLHWGCSLCRFPFGHYIVHAPWLDSLPTTAQPPVHWTVFDCNQSTPKAS